MSVVLKKCFEGLCSHDHSAVQTVSVTQKDPFLCVHLCGRLTSVYPSCLYREEGERDDIRACWVSLLRVGVWVGGVGVHVCEFKLRNIYMF